MKKLLVSVLFIMGGIASYAQFTQGTIMVGGNAGADFEAQKNKDGNTTTVTGHTNSVYLMPTAGYFIIDNLAVGAGVSMSASKYKSSDGTSTSTSRSASLAPFARYYYQRFFGQGSFQFGNEKSKTTFDGITNESASNISGWSLAAGYAYLLNQNVAVEPMIGYGSVGHKAGDNKDVDSGLFIRIGFQIYLTKQ